MKPVDRYDNFTMTSLQAKGISKYYLELENEADR
ncbi:hypothetical protein B879_03851 [Cecembia lonarensis LW9]|uniref:Uncharacterized protein n=1 Tax=Cecembia lonarensis (strain CCUG 58316 / KCTC 22772 / LW9) TaxID=1225176 RepID=K1LTQ8_CECL9|nr:hypothetical protein B879_03851 [Cecembia lonarensis LW9]